MRLSAIAPMLVLSMLGISSVIAAPPVQRFTPPPRVTPGAAAGGGAARTVPANIGSYRDKVSRFKLDGSLPPLPAPDLTVTFGEPAPSGVIVETSGVIATAGVPITGTQRGFRMSQSK